MKRNLYLVAVWVAVVALLAPLSSVANTSVSQDSVVADIKSLIQIVEGLHLDNGIEKGLVSKLKTALGHLTDSDAAASPNKLSTAEQKLQAFKSEIMGWYGRRIPWWQCNDILAPAEQIIIDLRLLISGGMPIYNGGGIVFTEDFDNYSVGVTPKDYVGGLSGGAVIEVTNKESSSPPNSLKLQSYATNGSYAEANFETDTPAKSLRIEFHIMFDNFQSWASINLRNRQQRQQWWWVRSDGTVFSGNTFTRLLPHVWYPAVIEADVDTGLVSFTINGATDIQLLPAFRMLSGLPNGLEVSTWIEVDQTIYIDDVKIIRLSND